MEECAAGVFRSLGEGRQVSAGFAVVGLAVAGREFFNSSGAMTTLPILSEEITAVLGKTHDTTCDTSTSITNHGNEYVR